jgi:hypothetical protein
MNSFVNSFNQENAQNPRAQVRLPFCAASFMNQNIESSLFNSFAITLDTLHGDLGQFHLPHRQKLILAQAELFD